MKTQFIKASYAFLVPVIFIGILAVLSVFPLNAVSKYGVGGILVTVIALALTYVAVKLNKTTFKAINFYLDNRTPFRFLSGFIVGALIIGLMLVVLITCSALEINSNQNVDMYAVAIGLIPVFLLAYMEEVIFRGYAFFKVHKHLGIWPAQILLGLLFVWYHDFTGATFFQQLLGPGVWALLFGLVTLRSNGIAYATGLHMALNVIQGFVGLKENREAIWSLEYVQSITPELQSQTETIGISLQIIVLFVGIILTEKYRRNINSLNSN